jgi:hypothetical protein
MQDPNSMESFVKLGYIIDRRQTPESHTPKFVSSPMQAYQLVDKQIKRPMQKLVNSEFLNELDKEIVSQFNGECTEYMLVPFHSP